MLKLIIITGMSGSGKTQAMRFFEDREYFCIDNIPPVLISRLLEVFACIGDDKRKIALVIDMRVGDMINELLTQIRLLRENGYSCELLFMDASDEALVKRYKETRRTHPIKAKGGLLESIHAERKMLRELYKEADRVIDTSDIKSAELYKNLQETYFETAKKDSLIINVMAFGFKYGTPLDADLVFDVRCFPNPFYVAELKEKTGNDKEVQEYVMNSQESVKFMEKLIDMIKFMIPLYSDEGKSSLTIAIGCTGGRHRSVTMANKLADSLDEDNYTVNRIYRDIKK